MKARALRSHRYTHTVTIRDHALVVDEEQSDGGDNAGPNPLELLAASLASCTAITVEMYASRKEWDIGKVEVEVDFLPAKQGCPTRFSLTLKLPKHLSPERVEKLQVIAAKCPVHRALEGEVMFEERVELSLRQA